MPDSKPRLQQRPFKTLAIEVLTNPKLPTVRAVAFRTDYGVFRFALTRNQLTKLGQMVKRQLDEMPNPS
jgi:hypothetical protein